MATSNDSMLQRLMATFPRPGRIEAIYLRAARNEPVRLAETATAIAGLGLDGDRAARQPRAGQPPSDRQVTLIQAEHLHDASL